MQSNASHQTKLAAATLAIPPTMATTAAVRYATINQAAELRPAFTPAAFRDLKFKAHDRKNSRGETIKGNGTGPAGVWVQIGAKVLVDLYAFDRWIDAHRMGDA
ncbi:MAG: hypothetical protein IPL72_18795 [Sulfuritalea sp.]|nr:hypothetical protein [Sulfuritalea sp.]